MRFLLPCRNSLCHCHHLFCVGLLRNEPAVNSLLRHGDLYPVTVFSLLCRKSCPLARVVTRFWGGLFLWCFFFFLSYPLADIPVLCGLGEIIKIRAVNEPSVH